MMKFKFLLWFLAGLMKKAIRGQPGCADYVRGKDLTFQIQTIEGVGRNFSIKNGRVRSSAGLTENPKFRMIFRDAAKGFSILSAKDGKEAFLNALQKQDLVISGDFVEVMWFQGLIEYIQAK